MHYAPKPAQGRNTVTFVSNSDMTEPAKIRVRQIRILYFESVRFGFITQSQLVQFNQVKRCVLGLRLCIFLFIFVFLMHYYITHYLLQSIIKHRYH